MTNNYDFTHTFTITQSPLDCSNVLVAKIPPITLTHQYEDAGGSEYIIKGEEFFNINPTEGCTLTCAWDD
jgi:hypothetical protein